MFNFFKRKTEIEICIDPEVQYQMTAYSVTAHPRETGGLLLGWYEKDTIYVKGIIDSSDDDASGNTWVRREDISQARLDVALATASDRNLGYIGDWHSHPANINASSTDISSLLSFSKQYTNPVAIIVHRLDGRLDVHAAQKGHRLSTRLR